MRDAEFNRLAPVVVWHDMDTCQQKRLLPVGLIVNPVFPWQKKIIARMEFMLDPVDPDNAASLFAPERHTTVNLLG